MCADRFVHELTKNAFSASVSAFQPVDGSEEDFRRLRGFCCDSWNAPGPRVVRHFGRTREDPWSSRAENFLVTPAGSSPSTSSLSRWITLSWPHRIDWVRFIASSLCTSPGWWVTSQRVTWRTYGLRAVRFEEKFYEDVSEIGGWLGPVSFSRFSNGFQACSWTHAHPAWDLKGDEVGPTRMFRFPCLTELVVGLRCQRKHDEV